MSSRSADYLDVAVGKEPGDFAYHVDIDLLPVEPKDERFAEKAFEERSYLLYSSCLCPGLRANENRLIIDKKLHHSVEVLLPECLVEFVQYGKNLLLCFRLCFHTIIRPYFPCATALVCG